MSATLKKIATKISATIKTAILISVPIALTFNSQKVDGADFTPQLIQEDLFFGRNIPGNGEVSPAQFQAFVNDVITPRFPNGLTIFDGDGQFLNSTSTVVKEKAKVVTLFAEDSPANQDSIKEIAKAYLETFNQESVLQVGNKDDFKVIFGVDEDLFANPPTPKFIEVDLVFGRNMRGNGEVSQSQFQAFVSNVITPRFPNGLTTFNADGQFLDSTGTIIKEKSKNVSLLVENTVKNEVAINEVVKEYIRQFQQESVLQAVNEDIKVSFGAGEDLFANSTNPKFIKVDLFFGRNVPGGGEVSQEQFQVFINNVITPRFPNGLTSFDADGQFLNNSGVLIQEKSKTVSLLLENTIKNESAINEIVKAYIQQFQQESVLQVVDEDVKVSFLTASNPTSVPEPNYVLGLVVLGGMGLVMRKKPK